MDRTRGVGTKREMELSRHFRISSRSHHGLVFVAELCQEIQGRPISIRNVAEKMHLSEKYLEDIVRALRAAGIVTSTRGRSGGYRLSKSAHTITMGAVVRALEGPVVLAHCQDPDVSDECPSAERCASRHFFARLKQAIDRELDGMTLAEFAA